MRYKPARQLSTSLEDYLEAIYTLSSRTGTARLGAVSRRLGISKPSVNSAVKTLAARGLVLHERYGLISLSPSGLKAGAEIAGRHRLLKDFFTSILALAPAAAERDACRAEHALSREGVRRVGALALFLKAPARRALLCAAKTSFCGKTKT